MQQVQAELANAYAQEFFTVRFPLRRPRAQDPPRIPPTRPPSSPEPLVHPFANPNRLSRVRPDVLADCEGEVLRQVRH